MKALDIDWRYLRRGMALPAAVLIAGIAVFVVSEVIERHSRQVLEMTQDRLATAEQLRNERSGKTAAATEFAAAYRTLVKTGVIGEEHRLERIQLLRNAVESLQLPYTRYVVSEQHMFEAPYLHTGLTSPVFASTLRLQLGLGHELDLLRLIARLRDGPGLLHVTTCDLTRVQEAGELTVSKPNIVGDCSMEWLSIPASSNEEKNRFGT